MKCPEQAETQCDRPSPHTALSLWTQGTVHAVCPHSLPPVASPGQQEENGAAETWLGCRAAPQGGPRGCPRSPHPPMSAPACPAQRQASGQRQHPCPEGGGPGSTPGCWPFPGETSGTSPEHATAPQVPARSSLHQLQADGVGCTAHRLRVRPALRLPSAPARPRWPWTTGQGPGAGVGQGRGPRALPHLGCRRGEVVGCVVSGQGCCPLGR